MIRTGASSGLPSAGRPARAASDSVISRRFKDAFKLALSYVIATGIALAMDWENPYWAALAIFMCSFTASGDSLNKGLLRIGGTAIAIVITIALVSVASQDRWLFLFLITAWIVLCGYMLTVSTKGYFWMCAGFTVPILAMGGGVHAASSFETVILRAQETGLGVLVYSLVSYLLWPVSGSGPLKQAFGDLVDVERRASDYLFELMAGHPEDGTADELRARATPILGRLPTVLDGAKLDSPEIRDQRHVWRRMVAELGEIRDALERWHSSLADVGELDLASLLPGLADFAAEIDRRLLAVQAMLQGQAPTTAPAVAEPGLDLTRLAALPLFDRAALISCTDQMSRVDQLTSALFTGMAAAQGFREARCRAALTEPRKPMPAFDPDRFLYAMRAFFAVWLAYLLAIYVPGLPGIVLVVALANSMGLALALMPQVPPTLVQRPVIRSLIFAGALYMLVLPHLSGYTELSIVLFLAVFGIAYRFPLEEAPLDRPVWLAALVLCTGVSNEQSFSFLHWANLMLPMVLSIWLVMLTGYFPVSYQPQDRFVRQLRRFFRSCSFLVSDSQWLRPQETTLLSGLRERFHANEVATIPVKMLAFCGGVQARVGQGASPSAQSLITTLQALRQRILEVHAARLEISPYARQLPGDLRQELSAWRSALHDLFSKLHTDPEALIGADLAGRLDAGVRRLEASVETAINQGQGSGLTDSDGLRLYRLLAALRDMSVCLIRFQGQAETFAWDKLRESRF